MGFVNGKSLGSHQLRPKPLAILHISNLVYREGLVFRSTALYFPPLNRKGKAFIPKERTADVRRKEEKEIRIHIKNITIGYTNSQIP